jgi:hypothetical protein
MRTEKTKYMEKQLYIAPDAGLRRVFLEDGIAAKASVLLYGAGYIQQMDWDGVTDEAVGDGTDTQGDIWFY